MELRSIVNCVRGASLAVAVLLLCTLGLPAAATGAASDYPAPLYLSSVPSSAVTTTQSFRLVSPADVSTPSAPTAVAQTGGTLPTGTQFSYAYTVEGATGGESAPSSFVTATTTAFPSRRQIQIGALPADGTKTVRVYRKQGGRFQLLTTLAANGSATWVDTGAVAPTTLLALTENRVSWNVTGFVQFSPGVPVTWDATNDNTPASAVAPTAPSGKGWIVDAPGNVHFTAGEWMLSLRLRTYGGSTAGVGEMRVGIWKVTTSGGAIATYDQIVSPAVTADGTATENVSANAARLPDPAVDYRPSVPAFSLAEDEHLYIELFRYQTTAYGSLSGGETRVASLYSNDGLTTVSHAGVSTLPDVPTQVAPVDGAVTNTSPTLRASFDDPDASGSGTLEFQLCDDPGCAPASVKAQGTVSSIPNGETGAWAVTAGLPAGTYYWQTRAQDAFGGFSAWSTSRSFRLNLAPSSASLSAPAAGAEVRKSSPAFSGVYVDPDGDDGELRFRVCRSASAAGAACETAVRAGASAAVANGSGATWTPALPLADGTYYWQARSVDVTGAKSGWSATRKLTIARQLIRLLSATRLSCTVGATLTATLKLAARASVSAYLSTRSRIDDVKDFGRLERGTRTLRLKLKWSLDRPAVYWIKWKATRAGERDVEWMRVELKRFRPGGPLPTCAEDTA